MFENFIPQIEQQIDPNCVFCNQHTDEIQEETETETKTVSINGRKHTQTTKTKHRFFAHKDCFKKRKRLVNRANLLTIVVAIVAIWIAFSAPDGDLLFWLVLAFPVFIVGMLVSQFKKHNFENPIRFQKFTPLEYFPKPDQKKIGMANQNRKEKLLLVQLK